MIQHQQREETCISRECVAAETETGREQNLHFLLMCLSENVISVSEYVACAHVHVPFSE